MLGVTPEMAFFFYSFFKLSIFCRLDEKFDGVCQQLLYGIKYLGKVILLGSRQLVPPVRLPERQGAFYASGFRSGIR